jgi:hypothetical protein
MNANSAEKTRPLNLSSVFIWRRVVEKTLEVYGLATEAPKILPFPQALRPFADEANKKV